MKSPLQKLIAIISFLGILVSLYLVYSDIKESGFCPKIFSIPACYIVLAAFILVFVSGFLKNKPSRDLIFYTGAIIGAALAIWFSYNQLNNLKECPKLFGLPLCYASLVTFLVLLVLKGIVIIKESFDIPNHSR
jgi:hypothetical protein